MENSSAKAAWNQYYVSNDEAIAIWKNWKEEVSVQKKRVIQEHLVTKLSYLVYSRVRGYKDKNYYEDLLQEGRFGLVMACERFDVNKGLNFFSFSQWQIQNQVRVFLRKKKNETREILCELDSSVFDGIIGGVDEEYEEIERNSVLLNAIDKLSDTDKKAIMMRFGVGDCEENTYEQIGRAFGFSRQRAEQVTSNALKRLKNNKIIKEFYGKR